MAKIENATITSTMLGTEDHGILTAMLMLAGDGWGIGFGGMSFDGPEHDAAGKFIGRRGSAFGMEWIRGLLDTLEVERWEQLPGKLVRVETEGWGGKAIAIGHPIKDRWFRLKGNVPEEGGAR